MQDNNFKITVCYEVPTETSQAKLDVLGDFIKDENGQVVTEEVIILQREVRAFAFADEEVAKLEYEKLKSNPYLEFGSDFSRVSFRIVSIELLDIAKHKEFMESVKEQVFEQLGNNDE